MLPLVILGVKHREWTVVFSYHRCELGLALAGGKTLQSVEYLLLIVSKPHKKKKKKKKKNRKADQRLPK